MKGSRLTTKKERDALARTFEKRSRDWGRKTLGGSCPTPGFKIRSGGRGRGLARGRGRGPLGIPFELK